MITLLFQAIGAGIYALPAMVLTTGVILGSFFLVQGALISLASMHFLMMGAFKHKKCDKYSEMVTLVFGNVKFFPRNDVFALRIGNFGSI